MKFIEKFLENSAEEIDFHEVRNTLDEMPKLRSEFELLFLDIVSKESVEESVKEKTDFSEMSDFETRWFKALSELQKLSTLILSRN